MLCYIVTMASSEMSASEISKSLNVMQAMNWMGDAWCNVKVTTIVKCFAAGGISSSTQINQDEEEDPFADLDETDELEHLVNEVVPHDNINAETYLQLENELPICYCVDNEQQLLDSLNTREQNEQVVISDEDDDEDNDNEDPHETIPTTSMKNYRDIVACVRDIEVFLIQRGLVAIASEFVSLSSKVAENALKKQSR